MSFLTLIRQILPNVSSLLSPSPTTPAPQNTPFTPTYTTIRQTRALLKSLHFPTELVLAVLDYAEYWPYVSFSTLPSTRQPSGRQRPIIARASGSRSEAAAICLATDDVFGAEVVQEMEQEGETTKVKRVEFKLRSRDQGWTSEGGESGFGGYSWVEIGILRRMEAQGGEEGGRDVAAEQPPQSDRTDWETPREYHEFVAEHGWGLVQRKDEYAWNVQVNRVSGPSEKYLVVWGRDGVSEGNEGKGDGEGFVEELKDGDRLIVWARARYPGWQCIVETVDVVVYFGF
ncbi:hypothetical protein PtrSN002B_007942 [Pyrenophora tritici-repentis]|uniref:Uncharacterized protein n=1 Tax=Pyrenophora tritici-repentis TaxID=45151 RepID=A0A922T0T6_9PLEO|nr:hypothetical protein Ptr86124_006271 [Pyrenophora tritici-repentis]KAI1533134.1 hypothetical protein PtrSN001C_007700 [Pyrenophora tritici-repentis]KAI1543163.1 hypothetical protein PtrSN002B_007942 [Pyrenophora tritici-repentis]KAI1585854.1 hypothetical protein PtrEW13061_007829 [Pyrenophora tritici-repentis]KAI1605934.1 hypothetical protein PtrCC142_001859 [Pyrenophora tritici-repentis]